MGVVEDDGRAARWASAWDGGASINCKKLNKSRALLGSRGASRAVPALGPETLEG